MIYYFSGTGNSLWVAKQLSNTLNDYKLQAINSYLPDENYDIDNNEAIGFVFPVYAWAPPQIVFDFIERLNIKQPSYLYFVCTCGDDTGKTAHEFMKVIKKKGWKCYAGYSVIMPNTYISLPGFDVDEPVVAKQKIKNAIARIEYIGGEIKQKIQQNKLDCHEGVFPRFKTYILRPLFYRYLMSPHSFHVTELCNSCKLCEKICPLQNIRIKNKPQWKNYCTHCLACYHSCPSHAIQYGGFTKGKGQYKGVQSFLK